jgi:hypothetical protein
MGSESLPGNSVNFLIREIVAGALAIQRCIDHAGHEVSLTQRRLTRTASDMRGQADGNQSYQKKAFLI